MKAIKSFDVLKSLCRLPSKKRVQLIHILGKDIVDAIAECAYNIAKNKVQVHPKAKGKILKYKRNIALLASKRTSFKNKKKIVIQKGGAILPFLIKPVLGVLTTLIAEKFLTKNNGDS